MKHSPHVVLLGAGASLACIPDGDKNGLKISCMDNFSKNTGIDIGYAGSFTNLEDIYQDVDKKKQEMLERKIWQYFDQFELPDEPTIYDVLAISLTHKDLIASFNWDPLLVEACQRCHKITGDLPEIVFLHGNVREWYAVEHDRSVTIKFAPSKHPDGSYSIKTNSGLWCCRAPLLYPTKDKDYNSNPYIKSAWNIFNDRLPQSFMLTIFGYACPQSDEEARTLLKDDFLIREAVGTVSDINNFKQLTIIDKNHDILSSYRELLDVPSVPFTEGIGDYVEVLDNFWDDDNWLLKWPRLSTEGYTLTQYEGKHPAKWPLTITKDNLSWETLKSVVKCQITMDEEVI
jgi:hypothetical protein